MESARGFRGWLAAITVGVTLTLVFLTVEKHIRIPTASFFKSPRSSQTAAATTAHRGIVLSIDPGLAGASGFPPSDRTPIVRAVDTNTPSPSVGLLRRPPEPAASVVLQAPIAELVELPLHGSSSKIEYLMDALDKAFESPMRSVSDQHSVEQVPSFPLRTQPLDERDIASHLPEPKRLLAELANLQQQIRAGERIADSTYPVSRRPSVTVTREEVEQIGQWVARAQTTIQRLVLQHGLTHASAATDLQELASLAGLAHEFSNSLADFELAQRLIGTAYSLERHEAVWRAIQGCAVGSEIAASEPRNLETSRQDLLKTIRSAEAKLGQTGDGPAWRKYLMLDELTQWANSSQEIWSEGNHLALSALSRIHWQRLNENQKRFLAAPEFEDLAAHLLVWGRDAVDYRQLLTELETLEEDPISRVSSSLASTVQVLRLSREEEQKAVAAAVNDHYRNANIRLSISQQLIERLLPENAVDSRPVRRSILGADTAGDSSVRTELKLKLIPDETGWNVGVGVTGDLVSLTRSSKGPAVFHNTSTAQIDSHRYVRLDPLGYRVSSEPTNVQSQDYLRNMSTDFDSLPIIGDFARFLVREQFNQKRGLAQRITRRIIAEEADAEFDRRLEESLAKAEKELQNRLVGPLESLNLNPLVVAMSTSEDRLTIRYRVANEQQMAANTPRPRAPTDSLLSMQLHQSAINNMIAQIGLSGRNWTIPQLYQRLSEVFQGDNWELPADMLAEVSEISIRFADTRPATVELLDGKLRLTLRIAEFRQGDRMHIERFIVSSNYIPAADGMTAELIRDGVVEIVSNHDRLKLRIIFAKVFVSNPQIPLISEHWASDPRSEGLAVSQVEIRDGWLAVAISKSDSERAIEVAARAQQLRLLK